MPLIGDLFNLVILGPAINLLVLLIKVFQGLHIPGALGFSIIVLTILIRLAVWRLMGSQLKSAQKMNELKPHLEALKKKHEGDKQALTKAQLDLYKEHGINPAGGCLPALVQIPIIIGLYQSIFAFFEGPQGLQKVNALLYSGSWHLESAPDTLFLGINLAVKPSEFAQYGALLLSIPVITGILTFVQSKMMTPKPPKTYPSDSPKEKKEKEGMEEALSSVQSQMVYFMPLMVGYFAFQFPVGLAIYWNIFTLLGIYQQYLVSGWGGLEKLIGALPLKKK